MPTLPRQVIPPRSFAGIAMSHDTDQLDDIGVIARTAWGEARSLGEQGMRATLNTGINRMSSGVAWWEHKSQYIPDTLRSIFLFHAQYSCWNVEDPNRRLLLGQGGGLQKPFDPKTDPLAELAVTLAAKAMMGMLGDITKGADSYYDGRMKVAPKWSTGLKPCFEITPHLYFRTV